MLICGIIVYETSLLYYLLERTDDMALKRGFQSDGISRLERVALRLVKGSGQELAYYKFQVNPQSYRETYTQRTTAFRTRTATVVEDYGRDLGTIEFSGTTGFKRDKSGSNGAERLAKLKYFLETYSNAGHRVDDVDQEELELYFYNLTDGGSYCVHLAPDGFQIERSAEQSLLYNYKISLVIIRDASDPDVREIDDPRLGNGTFYELTSQAINPNSQTATYQNSIKELRNQLGD